MVPDFLFMKETLFTITIESPLGLLQLTSNNRAILSVSFTDQKIPAPDSKHLPEILYTAKIQFSEYFLGNRTSFSFPVCLSGTIFQKKVWNTVTLVPYGDTCTYGEIAKKIGNEAFTRAVGLANSKNPLLIIIPCHRIVGARGKLTGYSGGLWRKKWLLHHEFQFHPSKLSLFGKNCPDLNQ